MIAVTDKLILQFVRFFVAYNIAVVLSFLLTTTKGFKILKTYNNFNEMFASQSDLRSDLSVFNYYWDEHKQEPEKQELDDYYEAAFGIANSVCCLLENTTLSNLDRYDRLLAAEIYCLDKRQSLRQQIQITTKNKQDVEKCITFLTSLAENLEDATTMSYNLWRANSKFSSLRDDFWDELKSRY